MALFMIERNFAAALNVSAEDVRPFSISTPSLRQMAAFVSVCGQTKNILFYEAESGMPSGKLPARRTSCDIIIELAASCVRKHCWSQLDHERPPLRKPDSGAFHAPVEKITDRREHVHFHLRVDSPCFARDSHESN